MMLHSKPLLVATTTTLLLLLGGLGRALALAQINRPSDASLPAAIAAATPKAPITPITPTAPTTPTTPATSKAAAIPAAIAAAAPKTPIAPIPPITSKAAAIHPDDLYHCDDPSNASNKLACDPTTFRWKLEDLDASGSPDDSNLCNELVAILVRSREQQKLDEGQLGNGHSVVGVWESTALGTTVDRLEPCVLWAMTYGPLVVGDAGSSLADSASGQQEHVFVKDSDSPETTELFVDFDPILVALVWERGISIPLSLDSAELHDLTGSHMLESLRAAIGHDTVEAIELTVAEGVPDFATDSLPLTLTGRVVFRDPKQALGPSSLRKVLLQSAFVDPDAMDLYLLRLRIARDATLNEVDVVVAGREALTDFFLGNANKKSNDYGSNNGDNNGNNSGQSLIDLSELNVDESSELLVSNLLIAILSAVAAAIVAVMCFAYCLMCRSKTSGQASKTLEEHSLVDENDVETGKRYRDGLPAVQTAPTGSNDDDDDEDDHRTGSGATNYDIEYMTGSQVDDGVSDYEMDTLPPPSTTHTDDEGSFRMRMTVIGDGYEDEDIMPSAGEEEDDVEDDEDARSAASDASASLYSYIPDDTSVSASLVQATGTVRTTPTHSNRSGQQQPSQSQSQSQSRSKHRSERPETTLEKTQKKSILWSVMDTLKKAPSDTTADSDKAEIYIETGASSKNSSASLSSLHKTRTTSPSAMLGPTSDNDSQSRDSNSLLYATDDDDNSEYGATSKAGIMSHRLKQNPYEYPEDSKEQFEKLWKNDDDDNDNDNDDDDDDDNDHDNDYDNDENHYDNNLHPGHNTSFDEAESVLGFVSSERAARKSREADRGPEPEDLVDWVPDEQAAQANEDDEESADQRVLPLPTALGSTAVTPAPASAVALDDCSVASSVSGQSNTSKNARGPMSARTKKNVWSSGSSVGSASVASTDSSMLRSLLGQSDTNDAALVFGSKQPARTKGEAQGKGQTQSSKERPTRDDSSSGSSSGSTPDVDLSMSSCTSTQLKSLLTHNGDDKDLSYEEDGLLFSETAAPPATTTTTTATTTAAAAASAATRGVEEEKKEGDFDDGDDRDATKMYLPASIRPASTATSPRNFDDNDDATVYSAFSEAPSVDGSIKSSMGWF